MTELERIGQIRTAATWLRRTSRPLSEYPKLTNLDDAMRREAQHFAAGILPWPSKWTLRLYRAATAG